MAPHNAVLCVPQRMYVSESCQLIIFGCVFLSRTLLSHLSLTFLLHWLFVVVRVGLLVLQPAYVLLRSQHPVSDLHVHRIGRAARYCRSCWSIFSSISSHYLASPARPSYSYLVLTLRHPLYCPSSHSPRAADIGSVVASVIL